MGAATEMDISPLGPFQTEWASLRVNRQNVLVEGSGAATNAALLLLAPLLRDPIVWGGTDSLQLPAGQAGALILKDVAALSDVDQARLLAWIGGEGSRTQILSTSTHPLFAAVACGRFEHALYYRLNVILLRLESAEHVHVA
jgi:sigma-54-interacting transcriptional regulator